MSNKTNQAWLNMRVHHKTVLDISGSLNSFHSYVHPKEFSSLKERREKTREITGGNQPAQTRLLDTSGLENENQLLRT